MNTKLFVFLGCLFLSFHAVAGLDEVVLKTADERCAIRYLTTTPMNKWTIETNATDCHDGWVHGFNTIKLKDARQQEKEILKGFFLDGYWLSNMPAKGSVQDRSNPEENVQALTFILGKDEELDITYLAQVRSIRPENRSYGAFQGCPIFRLLAVHSDETLFQNEAFQEKLASTAINYAKHLCSDLETIAIFGAKKLNARAPDIVFQMQIDMDTDEKVIIPIDQEFIKTDLNQPIEIKQETSKVLLSVEPSSEKLLVHYGEKPVQKTSQEETVTEIPITSLVHLDIQSRFLNQPVEGRTIVHINRIDIDGTGYVDLPQNIILKYYPHLKMGWAIIKGNYFHNQMNVSEAQFCREEWCSDVS